MAREARLRCWREFLVYRGVSPTGEGVVNFCPPDAFNRHLYMFDLTKKGTKAENKVTKTKRYPLREKTRFLPPTILIITITY